jgi:hypothetical protein
MCQCHSFKPIMLQLFDVIFYFHIASTNILFVQLAYLYQCFLLLNHLSTSLPSQPRKKKGIFKWLQDQITYLRSVR